MSRDWTPRETYYADKQLQELGKGSLFEITENMVWHDGNGNSKPYYSDEQMKIKKKYKWLGNLFSPVYDLYKKMSEHPKYRNRILQEIEDELTVIINTNAKNKDETVWLWYIGRLDEGFYYNEYNNELFYDYIMQKYSDLIKKT